jgi:hypothetical protein
MTTTDYRVAVGHNIALASMTKLAYPFSYSPRGGIVRPTRRSYLGDGTVWDEGLWVPFSWSSMRNPDYYESVLSAFGLSVSTTSANVTVYCLNQVLNKIRYNGRAILPEPGADLDYNIFPRDITIIVRDLVALA